MPAPTADAAGGVAALAQASDAVIGDMLQWLATLPMKP
jgi:cholesterol transport system auxiliary component